MLSFILQIKGQTRCRRTNEFIRQTIVLDATDRFKTIDRISKKSCKRYRYSQEFNNSSSRLIAFESAVYRPKRKEYTFKTVLVRQQFERFLIQNLTTTTTITGRLRSTSKWFSLFRTFNNKTSIFISVRPGLVEVLTAKNVIITNPSWKFLW